MVHEKRACCAGQRRRGSRAQKFLLAAFCGETVDHCDCGARPHSIFASPGSYTVIAGMGQLITALGPDSESSVGGAGTVISFIGYTYKGLLSNSALEVFLWAHNLEK